MRVSRLSCLGGLLFTAGLTSAIELDVNSDESVLAASRTVVNHIFTIYKGNETGETPGLLPNPYYWWESGLMFDSLLNYWSASGDTDLTDVITQGLLFQVGPDNNYMPPNQSKSLGNDDQSFWANAAMTAAEVGFPEPPDMSWVELAENVFNSQVLRWDESSCGGGLKWQIFTFNNGYNYKNSVSTLSFATLAARLARYTGNSTYTDWAQRSTEWLGNVGLLRLPSTRNTTASIAAGESANSRNRVQIFDGTDDITNCTETNHLEWSQNAGLFLSTSAYASNATMGTRTWNAYSSAGILYANGTFATAPSPASSSSSASSNNNNNNNNNSASSLGGILTEPACLPSGNCNVDQLAFRASLARGLSRTLMLTLDSHVTTVHPSQNGGESSQTSAHETITSILRTSAQAAAKQCTGGESGDVCGFDWRSGENDGMEGIGEDLAALEVFLGLLGGRTVVVRREGEGGGSNSSMAGSGGGGGGSGGSGNATGSGNGTEAQGDQNAASSTLGGVSVWGLSAVMLGALAFFV
ncbi:putative glycoside hydrolase, family 76, six-hairpin glycosidase superfamily [Septoria linicola]|nr:putative glycoside hydrolase, family 76, six-hairpin glycosidase superfamily [Septoria linicola]